MKCRKRGITLVEVVIAFVVLGMLFYFIYPVISYSSQAGKTMNRLDVYHDIRRVENAVFSELKLGAGILYPAKSNTGLVGDWYHQLVFRNHLNQVLMLYVNENDKLVLFNYDAVNGSYLSLGKFLGSKVKDFAVRRHGSSVVEYRLTFEINNKDFVVSNCVALVNVF